MPKRRWQHFDSQLLARTATGTGTGTGDLRDSRTSYLASVPAPTFSLSVKGPSAIRIPSVVLRLLQLTIYVSAAIITETS